MVRNSGAGETFANGELAEFDQGESLLWSGGSGAVPMESVHAWLVVACDAFLLMVDLMLKALLI